jgi:hypothetical protein
MPYNYLDYYDPYIEEMLQNQNQSQGYSSLLGQRGQMSPTMTALGIGGAAMQAAAPMAQYFLNRQRPQLNMAPGASLGNKPQLVVPPDIYNINRRPRSQQDMLVELLLRR